MQNPRLATRYAKSLLDLAVETNSVEATLRDMLLLNEICTRCYDFVLMLRSPVISGDKKNSVVELVLKDYQISEITYGFVRLLIAKGRELNLPEIAEAFITQYNTLKNIRIVKLTTAVPMADSLKTSIQSKVAAFMPADTIDLVTATDEELIGGFVLEVEDKRFDASVRKSLTDIRMRIVDHSYESKL